MNNFLAGVKRGATSKRWRPFLFLAVLATVLLLHQTALAAPPDRFQLDLWLRDSRSNYSNDARSGQDNKFFLDVRNNGNRTITNIRLSADAPAGWTIDIKPAEIASLSAGSVQTANVSIRPVGSATTQGYQVSFSAQATEISNVKQSFQVTVKPAPGWLWVWLVVGLLVVAGFVLVYRRFSKQ